MIIPFFLTRWALTLESPNISRITLYELIQKSFEKVSLQLSDVWLFPVWAAAARSQVLSLLLSVRSVERGRSAGIAFTDHIYRDDAEGDTGVDLESQYLESKRLLWLRYELCVLLPVPVVLSPLDDVPSRATSLKVWITAQYTYLMISAPPSKSGCSQVRTQEAAVSSSNQGFLGWCGRSKYGDWKPCHTLIQILLTTVLTYDEIHWTRITGFAVPHSIARDDIELHHSPRHQAVHSAHRLICAVLTWNYNILVPKK